MSSLPPVDLFHTYIYASAAWYFIRATARTVQPETVFRWFEAHPTRASTSLEIYNIRTDALCLALISFLLIAVSGVENPIAPPVRKHSHLLPKTAGPVVEAAWKRKAQLAIAASIAHHLGTAFFAYLQWADPRTTTGAMTLGWVFSSAISLLGLAAWFEVGRVSVAADRGRRKSEAADAVSTPTARAKSESRKTPKRA